MRQSERDARFARCLARVFPSGASLVAIGAQVRFSSGDVTTHAGLDAIDASACFGGAVLRLHDIDGLGVALARLSCALSDGAPILLVAASRASAAARLSGLLTRVPPTLIALDALCGSLLRAGLETPRVHDDLPDTWLVSGRRPARREALDDFFAQPAHAPRR